MTAPRKPPAPRRSAPRRASAPPIDRKPARPRQRVSEALAGGDGRTVRPWCKRCRARNASFGSNAKAGNSQPEKLPMGPKSQKSAPPRGGR